MKTLLFIAVCICIVCGAPQYGGYDDDYDDIFSDGAVDIFDDDIFNDDDTEDGPNQELKIQDDTEGCTDLGNKDFLFDLRSDQDVIQDCNKNVTCSQYASQGFSCAPYYQCKDNDRSPVITSGEGETHLGVSPIDLRTNLCVKLEATLDASDLKCKTDGYVCCKNPDVNAKICDAEKNDDVFEKCGRTSQTTKITKLDSKAKGSAQPGEFTHMCIIYRHSKGVRLYVGGASLIAKNKVITVAHKFWVVRRNKSNSVDLRDRVSEFKIRCGEYNVKREKEIIAHQETDVAAMYFHPLYDPSDKYVPNNLVILRTRENFIFQDHIGPVCLPTPTDSFEKDEDCSSSGWGKKQFDSSGEYADILKKINMGIVSTSQCNKKLRTKLKRFTAHKSMVCVGGEKKKDTCTGDGGSPHVCRRDGKWYQVGAVAWGIGCGTGIPAIYASIPDAMCWIDQIMTCVPTAAKDINNDDESKDKRGTGELFKSSINELREQDCRAWVRNQVVDDIGDCEVSYGDGDDGK